MNLKTKASKAVIEVITKPGNALLRVHEIAKMSGVSSAQVSRVMCFLRENPDTFEKLVRIESEPAWGQILRQDLGDAVARRQAQEIKVQNLKLQLQGEIEALTILEAEERAIARTFNRYRQQEAK